MASNNLKIGKQLFIDPLGKKNLVIVFAGFFAALNQIADIILPGKIINALYPVIDIRATMIMVSAYVAAALIFPYMAGALNRQLNYYNLTIIPHKFSTYTSMVVSGIL